MKRLLCIIDSLNVGGAETFLMKIMRSLPPNEYQFDFVVSKSGGVYEKEVFSRGGKVFEVPPRRTDLFGALKAIKTVVRQNNYNYVLRLGDAPMVGLDLIAAKFGGAKKLAFRSCNALTDISRKERLVNAVMRPVLNIFTDVKIAPSDLAAEFVFGKRKANEVHIVHNGVDLKQFKFDRNGRISVREEFSLADKFVVGHIGRFNKQKNHQYLLKIFKEICDMRDDAVLLLVGTGEDHDLICKMISELGLEKNVIMTGQRFDIPQLLSAMDIFVFPSLHEGMPNTVIEAQATGLPCVIADTITREADITGLVQYLSLSKSAKEWAEAALAASAQPRKETSDDFREKGYDIEIVAKEIVDLLGMNV